MKSKGFEGSKFDKDRGVKEGSKADLARDAVEKNRRLKMKGKKSGKAK